VDEDHGAAVVELCPQRVIALVAEVKSGCVGFDGHAVAAELVECVRQLPM
jgi:hypothetical protein